ncbi:MAG TPA: glycosyltransferase [Candidatus Dojkabacteria bacterium]|jgi:glycosyltransferase involved in cell wall biosynthesis
MSEGEIDLSKLKVAITHDFLVENGGAEKVLVAFMEIFPNAEIYTSIYKPERFTKKFNRAVSKHKLITTNLDKLLPGGSLWKLYIPLIKNFFQKLNFEGYDLVISNSSSFAKWFKKPKTTRHVAYINTPPRFIWGIENATFHKFPKFFQSILSPVISRWRKIDAESAKNADVLIANSENIRGKIKKFYKSESVVIHPPVEVEEKVKKKDLEDDGFYLVINRLVAYKRIDTIIKYFNETSRRLVIVGEGSERKYLESISGDNVFFTGFITDKMKFQYLKKCKALIYPGEEDFGIAMVESLLFGKPVVAYKKGGSLEIIDKKSGVFYEKNTIKSVSDSIKKLENMNIEIDYLMKKGKGFSKQEFKKNIVKRINQIFA